MNDSSTMKRKLYFILLVFICSFSMAETVRIEPLKRPCIVLLPQKANYGLKYAAEELTYHVAEMTGVKMTTIVEPESIPDGAFVFSLGETDFAKKFGISGIGLPHNHASFLGDNDKMILTGNDRGNNLAALLIETSGTLFALYDILENDNGCHWLWPGKLGEIIPKKEYFQFEAGQREMSTKLKFFFWRQLWGRKAQWPSQESFSYFMTQEVKWLLRHRSNRDLSEQHYPHAFESWPDKYLKSHPEFFNLLPDGTRRPSPLNWGGQAKLISMCTGSAAFRQQVVKDWLENFNPNIPRINLKSNDSNLQCVCDDCMSDDHSPIPTDIRRARAKERYDKKDPKWVEELGSMTNRQIAFYLGVMAEADRVAPEKKAKFSGLIYANSATAPENVFLGPRFQFCYCPSMYFPWTDEKIDYYIRNWEGWYKTGIDMVIRPNFTLDGHCYPIAYDRDFHKCFLYAEPRALKGSDYDSLTGMYAAQGLTLYTIARLQNSRQGLPFETIEKEYCSAFGKAEPLVRKYFERLWEISHNSKPVTESNRPEGGNWTHYFLAGHDLFTQERFVELNNILQEASCLLPSESIEAKRIHFLWLGLENARLTAETASAYDDFQKTGDYIQFAEKVNALDKFRQDNEFSNAFNIGYCREREDNNWPRGLAKQMTKDTIALPIEWHFKTDPAKTGEANGWADVAFDESAWEKIPTDRPWDKSGYETYDGYGWYRLRIQLPEKMPGNPVLMVGSADEACDVWINGQKVLHRPYPFEGNTNSWNEAFNVPFGNAAHVGENVIAIRVEDNNGQGGLTKRCFLKYVQPEKDDDNALRNSHFENGLEHWNIRQRNGINKASVTRFDGKNALCCQAISPDETTRVFNKYSNYLMLHQKIEKLIKGKKYLVTVEFRTTSDYDGVMMVFCHSDVQRDHQSVSNIQLSHDGKMLQWGTVSKEFVAGMDSGDFYLNYVCNKGQLYFSSVSIVCVE